MRPVAAKLSEAAFYIAGWTVIISVVWVVLWSGIIVDGFNFVHPFGTRCAVGVLGDVFESLRCPDSRPIGNDFPPDPEPALP
jgi:hypothetical protein